MQRCGAACLRPPPFNSLFEMPAADGRGSNRHPTHLSILYLRCPTPTWRTSSTRYSSAFNSLFEMLSPEDEARHTKLLRAFNSLFEMPSGGGACRGVGSDRLSILYLRCQSKAPSSRHLPARRTFNSLFEMPQYS